VFLLQEIGTGCFKKKGRRIPVVGELFVFKEVRAVCWAHAYVVTRKSAQSLIGALTPVTRTADSWGWLIRHRAVTVYCMNRTLSAQNMYNLNSIIGFDRCRKNTWLFGRVTHKAYRAFWLAADILSAFKKRIL
jgi:hypothetical protein